MYRQTERPPVEDGCWCTVQMYSAWAGLSLAVYSCTHGLRSRGDSLAPVTLVRAGGEEQ